MNFEHLLGLHTGTRHDPMSIAVIDSDIAQALGSLTRNVFLSAETVRKQLRHHRELPISIYRQVAPCLRVGLYRQDGPRSAIVLFTDPNMPTSHFRAYIKATAAGHEIYLASFFTMRDRDLRRELRKPYLTIRSEL